MSFLCGILPLNIFLAVHEDEWRYLGVYQAWMAFAEQRQYHLVENNTKLSSVLSLQILVLLEHQLMKQATGECKQLRSYYQFHIDHSDYFPK